LLSKGEFPFKGLGNFGERLYTYMRAKARSEGLGLVWLFEVIYFLLRYICMVIAGVAMARRKEFFG